MKLLIDAETEYVAFLDADDWWDCDKARRQLEVLDAAGSLASTSGSIMASNP